MQELGQTKKTSTKVDEESQKAEDNLPAQEPVLATEALIVTELIKFQETLKLKGLNAEAAILSKPFELKSGNIVFKLNNLLEEDFMDNIKQDLTQVLRESTKTNLNIFTETEVENGKKMIYTNKEKYDHLVNKKPILKEFKDRLGLDTDF